MKIKKWKNTLEISSFYRCVPKIMITGFIVPEIWHVTDVIIFQFGQFFALLPPNSPQKKKIKKMKKTPGDFIILPKCTKNYDYRLYYSWDTAHDECNCYFSFRAIFCPFTPLTAQKSKISKNKKKRKNKKTLRYHPVTRVHWKLWLDDVRSLRYGARRTDGRMEKSDI